MRIVRIISAAINDGLTRHRRFGQRPLPGNIAGCKCLNILETGGFQVGDYIVSCALIVSKIRTTFKDMLAYHMQALSQHTARRFLAQRNIVEQVNASRLSDEFSHASPYLHLQIALEIHH
jgi:hypothetical protein